MIIKSKNLRETFKNSPFYPNFNKDEELTEEEKQMLAELDEKDMEELMRLQEEEDD